MCQIKNFKKSTHTYTQPQIFASILHLLIYIPSGEIWDIKLVYMYSFNINQTKT